MTQINNTKNTQTRKLGVMRNRNDKILKIEKTKENIKTILVYTPSKRKYANEEPYDICSLSINENGEEKAMIVNNKHEEELMAILEPYSNHLNQKVQKS